jgi:hypothetical protein
MHALDLAYCQLSIYYKLSQLTREFFFHGASLDYEFRSYVLMIPHLLSHHPSLILLYIYFHRWSTAQGGRQYSGAMVPFHLHDWRVAQIFS